MTKINELKEHQRLTMPLLIKDCVNGTTNKGAPYLSLVLADSSGQIDGKFWDVKDEDIRAARTGRVAMISFDVLLYKNNLQLRITHIDEMDQKSVNMEDFVTASARSEEDRRQEVRDYIHKIKNPTLRTLVIGMIDKVKDKYFDYPAASRIHHNFMGGLSEHSLSMAELCEAVCDHYPQLNRDLLIAGALVHDVGKTVEMSGPVTTEYTLEGKLEGHISIGNGILSEVAAENHLEDKEETALLHHMILSHHGHYEYGSPVLPMTQEAEVLATIDNLDARMNTLKQVLGSLKPGEWSTRQFAMENRQFYKPVFDSDSKE